MATTVVSVGHRHWLGWYATRSNPTSLILTETVGPFWTRRGAERQAERWLRGEQ